MGQMVAPTRLMADTYLTRSAVHWIGSRTRGPGPRSFARNSNNHCRLTFAPPCVAVYAEAASDISPSGARPDSDRPCRDGGPYASGLSPTRVVAGVSRCRAATASSDMNTEARMDGSHFDSLMR